MNLDERNQLLSSYIREIMHVPVELQFVNLLKKSNASTGNGYATGTVLHPFHNISRIKPSSPPNKRASLNGDDLRLDLIARVAVDLRTSSRARISLI